MAQPTYDEIKEFLAESPDRAETVAALLRDWRFDHRRFGEACLRHLSFAERHRVSMLLR